MRAREDVLEGPARALAEDLRAHGRALAAAALVEVVPDGPARSDDHLPELVRRLRRLAGAADLPAPLREQARALLDAARSLPTAVGRGGTVFAAWLDLPGPEGGHYAAYWDASPDASCFLEQGPGTADLDALLAWADERSDRVVVRPSWDPSHHYWAGRAGRPATTPPLRRPGPGEPAPA